MKPHLSTENKKQILVFSISGIIVLVSYLALSKTQIIAQGISAVFGVIMPFVFGYAIMFILAPLMFKVEKLLGNHTKWKKKTIRGISVLFSILFMILMIVIFCAVVFPQLFTSVATLANSTEGYFNQFQVWASGLSKYFNTQNMPAALLSVVDSIQNTLRNTITEFVKALPGILSNAIIASFQAISVVFNLVIGTVVAVYLLLDYERFHRQAKMLVYATFTKKFADEVVRIGNITAEMFNKFVVGKAIDSLIIGILCLIGCLIFGFPYASLIAFVVGVTNMIPFFGPFIGAIPCIFLLLLVNPIYALWFGLFVFALQQVDGNIIGPAILGDSLGLPSIWILFAVTVGGGLFGIVGMVIGVPTFAVIYTLLKEYSHRRLEQKEIKV
ncbi:MAG: AI-2E family transporter [Erysipelotrichaceae bacterium]|nr:AI-2E family transporter [Erysipelotrichaceae bacterium]